MNFGHEKPAFVREPPAADSGDACQGWRQGNI